MLSAPGAVIVVVLRRSLPESPRAGARGPWSRVWRRHPNTLGADLALAAAHANLGRPREAATLLTAMISDHTGPASNHGPESDTGAILEQAISDLAPAERRPRRDRRRHSHRGRG